MTFGKLASGNHMRKLTTGDSIFKQSQNAPSLEDFKQDLKVRLVIFFFIFSFFFPLSYNCPGKRASFDCIEVN